MTSQESELLVDLAKLVRKHGPDVFRSLAAALSDPSFGKELAILLNSVSREQSSGKSRNGVRGRVSTFKTDDPEKNALLQVATDVLCKGRVLQSLHDVKLFAGEKGILLAATNRNRAVKQLLDALADFPMPELKLTVDALLSVPANGPGDLSEWSRFVLDPERPSRATPR